jgi:hypothetical protein
MHGLHLLLGVGRERLVLENHDLIQHASIGPEGPVTLQPVPEQRRQAEVLPSLRRQRDRHRVAFDHHEAGFGEHRLQEAASNQVGWGFLEQHRSVEIPVHRPLLPQPRAVLVGDESRRLVQRRLEMEAELSEPTEMPCWRKYRLEVLAFVLRRPGAGKPADPRMFAQAVVQDTGSALVQPAYEDDWSIRHPCHLRRFPVTRPQPVRSVRTGVSAQERCLFHGRRAAPGRRRPAHSRSVGWWDGRGSFGRRASVKDGIRVDLQPTVGIGAGSARGTWPAGVRHGRPSGPGRRDGEGACFRANRKGRAAPSLSGLLLPPGQQDVRLRQGE